MGRDPFFLFSLIQKYPVQPLLGTGSRIKVVGIHLMHPFRAVMDNHLLPVEMGMPEYRCHKYGGSYFCLFPQFSRGDNLLEHGKPHGKKGGIGRGNGNAGGTDAQSSGKINEYRQVLAP
jgi:hypothetical protein